MMFAAPILAAILAAALDYMASDSSGVSEDDKRDADKHKNDDGSVVGDKVAGVVTGGDGAIYKLLFSIDGENVMTNADRSLGNAWIISGTPGVPSVLWGVRPPSTLTTNNDGANTSPLLKTDIIRFEPEPSRVYSSSGALKGVVMGGKFDANGGKGAVKR